MKSLTPRQRLLTALDGGVPDHLPASVHGWMRYWLDKYLNGASPEQAFERFDLGWSLYEWKWDVDKGAMTNWQYELKELDPIDGNRIELQTITTPEKTFTQTRLWDNFHSPWITEYLLVDPEDIFIYCKFHPTETLDLDFERRVLDKLGDRGILRNCRIGPWHRLCEYYGVEKMIINSFEYPDWTHHAMHALTELDLRCIASMNGSKTDLVETGGGHNSSTVVSPSLFSEFILPYEKRIHDKFNELGLKTVYHTCGGMMPILDLLVEIGSTSLETLTPPALGGDVDLAELKKQVGDRVSLIGGFDQYNGFENASSDETRRQVRHCFETAGAGGGYIMNPSDHFFEGSVENLEAYADEAKKCVY